MPSGDLDTGLLLKIMKQLGEVRGSEHYLEARELYELVPALLHESGRERACRYIQRHIKFLRQCELVHSGPQIPGYCTELLSLTAFASQLSWTRELAQEEAGRLKREIELQPGFLNYRISLRSALVIKVVVSMQRSV
jgi:hypothetical protein